MSLFTFNDITAVPKNIRVSDAGMPNIITEVGILSVLNELKIFLLYLIILVKHHTDRSHSICVNLTALFSPQRGTGTLKIFG